MPDISRDLAARLLAFAERRSNATVGRGECYDLANLALESITARSAPDYGTITRDADYIWGREIPPTEILPGDVIQFRNFSFTLHTTTDVTRTDGGGEISETEESYDRPHHTAIVADIGQHGRISIYEQNFQNVRCVGRRDLYRMSSEFVESRTGLPWKS